MFDMTSFWLKELFKWLESLFIIVIIIFCSSHLVATGVELLWIKKVILLKCLAFCDRGCRAFLKSPIV